MGQRRGGWAELSEDPAGVQPADSQLAEDVVPIEVARFKLARGGVAAVRNPHCAAHTEAAFGEVKPIADDATDTVKRHPLDELGVHTALQNKVFDEPANVVVRKRGANG